MKGRKGERKQNRERIVRDYSNEISVVREFSLRFRTH